LRTKYTLYRPTLKIIHPFLNIPLTNCIDFLCIETALKCFTFSQYIPNELDIVYQLIRLYIQSFKCSLRHIFHNKDKNSCSFPCFERWQFSRVVWRSECQYFKKGSLHSHFTKNPLNRQSQNDDWIWEERACWFA
jgi:hypothetical protein